MMAAAGLNQPEVSTEKVSQEFIKLYYKLLNECPDYLHQLYKDDSSAMVSEAQDKGPPCRVQADNIEEIKQLVMMFGEVNVTITNCTPQCSLDGSLMLLVTGKMVRKSVDDEDCSDTERLFTQAFVLAKQETGYYVRTDTLQVHSRGCSYKFLSKAQAQAQGNVPSKPAASLAPQSPLRHNPIIEQEPVYAPEVMMPHSSPVNLAANPSPVQAEPMPVTTPQVDLSQPRVPDSQPASQELSRPPQEPESTNSNYNGIEVPGKNAMNPKGPEDGKKMNKLDERVEPPVKTITPISGPPPKLSYAQVARMKQMEAAAAAESQASRQQDFKLVSRRPKPPSEPNLPSQTPPQDPGWTQSPPVAVAAERQQEKSSFSGSQAVGLPSNRKLFVCRLPLNITATKVAEIFSKFGETVEPGSVKVSTGPNNCFAYITFNTEAAVQEALNAKIDIGTEKLVIERWENRGKGQRQTGGRHGSGGRGGQHRRKTSWEHV